MFVDVICPPVLKFQKRILCGKIVLFGVSATIISLTLGAMKAARRFLAHFARIIAQFAGRRSGIVNKSPILNAHGKEINFQIAEKVVLGWWSLAFSEVCPSTISGNEVQQAEELVFPSMDVQRWVSGYYGYFISFIHAVFIRSSAILRTWSRYFMRHAAQSQSRGWSFWEYDIVRWNTIVFRRNDARHDLQPTLQHELNHMALLHYNGRYETDQSNFKSDSF